MALSTIRGYIEIFHSRQRTQAHLDYRSPAAFMQRFHLTDRCLANPLRPPTNSD
ncbi:hypothetical protein [Burkholderia sp. MSMB1552]|uniref:hypothetical protein n=1 Tax=Burkholderia sp. MSMB1552 TaxID=1636424 RepID=UPI000A736F6B|nr:hypothetical protein [Burkholderia sp. MSMB1552]